MPIYIQKANWPNLEIYPHSSGAQHFQLHVLTFPELIEEHFPRHFWGSVLASLTTAFMAKFFHNSNIKLNSFLYFFSQLPIFLVLQMKIITFPNCTVRPGIRLGLPLFIIHFPNRTWVTGFGCQELQFLPTFAVIHQGWDLKGPALLLLKPRAQMERVC